MSGHLGFACHVIRPDRLKEFRKLQNGHGGGRLYKSLARLISLAKSVARMTVNFTRSELKMRVYYNGEYVHLADLLLMD